MHFFTIYVLIISLSIDHDITDSKLVDEQMSKYSNFVSKKSQMYVVLDYCVVVQSIFMD